MCNKYSLNTLAILRGHVGEGEVQDAFHVPQISLHKLFYNPKVGDVAENSKGALELEFSCNL